MKAILIFSGGMDSATLLFSLLHQGHEVKCLGIDYGQRHRKEIEAAMLICGVQKIPYTLVDLSAIRPLLKGSSQTDDTVEVPEGHYAEENMKKTVVPNRNMIMLSVAAAYAISEKADAVVYGAHSGDHAIYPDCRPEFVKAMTQAMELADWHTVTLVAPFSAMTKGEIAKLGLSLKVPYELTWTCYAGREKHCGKCGSCSERLEAFEFAGAADPVAYEV